MSQLTPTSTQRSTSAAVPAVQYLNSPLELLAAVDWSKVGALIGKLLRQLICRENRNLYQILNYELELDLVDPQGRVAYIRRRQKVRFLQDHVIAYQDEAWGEGNPLASYHCSPGVPVDHFQVGSRHLILISLRQTRNRGDEVVFNIERKIEGGFTKAEERVEVETRYPTDRLRITVLFPKGRPGKQAWIRERLSDRVTELSAEHFSDSAEGRKAVSWELLKPRFNQSYTLVWHW